MNKSIVRSLLLFSILSVLVIPFQNCKVAFDSTLSSVEKTSEDEFFEEPIIVDPKKPEDPEPGEDHGIKKKTETAYQPVLADRYYLKSLFTNIFGPTTETVDSTKMFNNALDHGSPCSLYEDQHALVGAKKTRMFPDRICAPTLPSYLIAFVNPKVTVSRQALTSRACSDLTNNDTTLKYALKRISSETIPSSTDENVLKLFRLFYVTHPDPDEELIETLSYMLPTQGATYDHWRTLIYTVCISGHWQIL